MGLAVVKDMVGQVGDQITDRIVEVTPPSVDAGAFLQDWITTKLPEAVVGLATRVAGREDGSGFIANEAIKAGTDQNFMGGILQ